MYLMYLRSTSQNTQVSINLLYIFLIAALSESNQLLLKKYPGARRYFFFFFYKKDYICRVLAHTDLADHWTGFLHFFFCLRAYMRSGARKVDWAGKGDCHTAYLTSRVLWDAKLLRCIIYGIRRQLRKNCPADKRLKHQQLLAFSCLKKSSLLQLLVEKLLLILLTRD